MTELHGSNATAPAATRRSRGVTQRWVEWLAAFLPRVVAAVAKHWLLMANVVLGIQALLPAAAPLLMASGRPGLAHLLYSLYAPLCHQLPERSFFVFGSQVAYTLEELALLVGSDVPLRYIGNSTVGYKLTVCQRDLATYAAMWLAGLAFVPLRQRQRPLPLRAFALLCLPVAADGFGQLLGLWDSTPWRRVITGALFGAACIWLAFPHIEAGMKDVVAATHPNKA